MTLRQGVGGEGQGVSAHIRIWPAWAGYVLSITLGLYSHYLAALVFLADNLFVLFLLVREWRSGRNPLPFLWRWSLAQIAVLALFAPWMALYLQNAISFMAAPVFDFGVFLRLAATVFPLGVTTNIDNYALPAAGMTLLAALGGLSIFASRRSGRTGYPLLSSGALFALLTVLIPPVLLYVLSLTPAAFFAPKIQARYLLVLLPAYALLLALGLLFLWRLPELSIFSRLTGPRAPYLARAAAAIAFCLVAIAQFTTLSDYYQGRILHDDYATLANVVNDFSQPGDLLLLNTDQEWPTFLYYLRRPADWLGVPNANNMDTNEARRLAEQAAPYRAVWLVTIPDALAKDPQHLLERALARYQAQGETSPHWRSAYEQSFGDNRLTLYLRTAEPRDLSHVPAGNFVPQFASDESFGEEARLLGLDLPVREVQPGDTLRVVTYWRAMAPTRAIPLLVRLATGDGATVTEQTTAVPSGDLARAQADLVIPPGTPAGPLNVVVRPCCRDVVVGSVDVIPRYLDISAGLPTHPLDFRLGAGIRLAGYNLFESTFQPSDSVPLTLVWKAEQAQTASYTVFVHLLGEHYNAAQNNFLWGQVDSLPRGGQLPTSAWPPGTTIDDPYRVPVAPNAPPGRYKIEVGLYDAAIGARLTVFDANGSPAGDAVIITEIEIE